MMHSDTPENYAQDDKNFQKAKTDPKSNPYDSENLDNESESDSKDITEKDIEENLLHNDPSEGFETEVDTHKSYETESDHFETIDPEKDNPVQKEFEIGELGNEELKDDELARDESRHGATRNTKPSQRKF
nr:hypothetical protein [uncultured Flavobacterium sp.]